VIAARIIGPGHYYCCTGHNKFGETEREKKLFILNGKTGVR